MRYLAAFGVGVVTAIAAAIFWIVVSFVLPILVPFLISRIGANQAGVGVSAAVISSGSVFLAALVGFLGGFGWMLWRRS
ncbi:MAG TPA: hypothetical protein VH701_22645 [Vicinamibacterales bacterium]|jgi:hypothetical protein